MTFQWFNFSNVTHLVENAFVLADFVPLPNSINLPIKKKCTNSYFYRISVFLSKISDLEVFIGTNIILLTQCFRTTGS